jgi:tape measure domain-containing protein
MATISNNEIKIKYTLDTTDLANATALFDRLSAEDRQLLNDLKKLQAQLNATGQAGQQAGNQIGQGTRNARNEIDQMGESVKKIGGYIATYFSVQAILAFGKAVLDTTIKMEGLRKTLEFTAGSMIGGAANFEYLKKTAEEFGIPLEAAVEGFKSFSAAANRANISVQQQRDMFRQLSTAMAAMNVTAQDAQLIFFGVGQMLAKPKVSAQELYHQIGERLPIAMEAAQIAAAKMTGQISITAGELVKLVEEGKLLSTEFAPAFFEALGQLGKSGAYIDTLGKDVNRLSNAWTGLKESLGDSKIIGTVVGLLDSFVKKLESINDAGNYYAKNGLFPDKSFQEFKKEQKEVMFVYDFLIEGTKERFKTLTDLNSQYQQTINDTTATGNTQRLLIETQFARERQQVVDKIVSEMKRQEDDIKKLEKENRDAQKKIDAEYLRTGYVKDIENRIDKNELTIRKAKSALDALKSIYGTLPEITKILPDEESIKKKNKALEDLYRKLIAQQEALKKAEDDRIKANTREGYTRDVKLLENNVKFNNEMLKIDEDARFKDLELAKNNAVKRRGENERDNQEQLNIRKKALDEALKIEKDYLKKSQDKIDEATFKRKQARQTDLQNELDTIKNNADKQAEALVLELNKAISIQEIGDAKRLEIIKRYDAQITKIKTDSLNQQLLALNKYYDEQAKLDEEAAFDREMIYSRAATRRLAADAKNEYDRQDILDQGTLADITTERNRLIAAEDRMKKTLGLSADYRDRESAMIKAKLADLDSQEYEIKIAGQKRQQEKMLEIVQASADAMGQIFNDLSNLYISNLDREKEALNQKYESDVRLADGNKQKLAQLAQEKARAEYEIELKQFKARQVMAVAEVIFKTAPEIAKWISTGVLAPVAAIGLAAQAFAIGAILSQPPPVPPYKDGTKGRPHPGGPALVGEAGTERVVTTDGQVYYTPPMATLIDLPKGAQVIPNHALSKKELFWANAMNQGRPIDPESGIGRKLDKIGGILESMPVHQINMNERGFEKFIRTPRRTSKILNNQFPSKL